MGKTNLRLLSKDEINKVLVILSNIYTDARCGLEYSNALELTVALILAAQCTDKRVNMILPILFEKYPNIDSLSSAKQKDVEEIIHSCGFYNNKAKNIILTSKIIKNKYNGIVPDTMEDLTSLAGIGRKSANIILQECFGKTVGIAVDTHVRRISKRLGLTNSTDPIKIEQDLMGILPGRYWNKINHILVCHGRTICNARKPKCEICPVNMLCKNTGGSL